jgi:hypothetical protein
MKTKQERIEGNQGRLEAKIEANSKKFEVLWENMWTRQEEIKTKIGALVSWIDAYQARMDSHH